MCRPAPPTPPGRDQAYMGDFTIPQVKFPLVGEDSVFKSPSQQGVLSPKQLHTSKQVIKAVFTTQSQVKSPSMGPTF